MVIQNNLSPKNSLLSERIYVEKNKFKKILHFYNYPLDFSDRLFYTVAQPIQN
jgi:hypothetical protein